MQTGHEHSLKELYSGNDKIIPPKMAKSLQEIIDKNANLLDKELKDIERNVH